MIQILKGDHLDRLKELEDGSIHIIITSPPYDKMRTYDSDSEFNFEPLAHELFRVLVPGGVLCWNVGDQVIDGSESLTSFRQAIYFRDVVGFLHHDTMIYEKKNFAASDSTRYHQCFEYVFICSKGTPRVFNPIIDRPNVTAGMSNFSVNNGKRQPDGSFAQRKRSISNEMGKRTNVWRGNSRGQENPCASLPHPAMMPTWLPRDLILTWSNAGDTVLDPMAGSGTTVTEALKLGRKAIAIEKNPAYIPLIEQATDVTIGLPL